MVAVSVRYLFYQPMDEKIKTWTLRFPVKENPPNLEKALFDQFFHRYVRLTNQSHARLHPLDKPIKSLHFRLFIVSDLFASFHFKVTRKLHYKYGNSRLKTLKTIPCSAVHTCLGQISPPPPLPLP